MNRKTQHWLKTQLGLASDVPLVTKPKAEIHPNELANIINDEISERFTKLLAGGAPLDQIIKGALLILKSTLCHAGTVIMQAYGEMDEKKADMASEQIATDITNAVIDSFKEAYGFAITEE